ncbi:MAG: hypothetical protein LBT75_01475 [Bacilli bacterium]|jgi:hypothetical protein|nr:hypothetical protein [Bacilli bacterium]
MKYGLLKVMKNKVFIIIILIFLVLPLLVNLIFIFNNSEINDIYNNIDLVEENLKNNIIMERIDTIIENSSIDVYDVIFMFMPLGLIDDFSSKMNYTIFTNKFIYLRNKILLLIIVFIIVMILLFLIQLLCLSINIIHITNTFKITYQNNYLELFMHNNIVYVMPYFIISLTFLSILMVLNNPVIGYLIYIACGYLSQDLYLRCGILIVVCLLILVKGKYTDDRVKEC